MPWNVNDKRSIDTKSDYSSLHTSLKYWFNTFCCVIVVIILLHLIFPSLFSITISAPCCVCCQTEIWPNLATLYGMQHVNKVFLAPLTIDVEHHVPHGRTDRLMETEPHLPPPPQGVVVAFWGGEKRTPYRSVPGVPGRERKTRQTMSFNTGSHPSPKPNRDSVIFKIWDLEHILRLNSYQAYVVYKDIFMFGFAYC